MRLLFAVTTSVVVVSVIACPPNFNEAPCQKVCHELDACGFLPSSLGTPLPGVDDVKNCISRCQETDNTTVTTIHSCFTSVVANDAGPCGKDCATVAKCLRQHYPSDGIVGRAQVRVVPVRRDLDGGEDGGQEPTQDAFRCEHAICPPDASVCPAGRFEEFVGELAGGWCNDEAARSARTFVLQGGKYTFSDDDRTCPELLAQPPTFTGLDPGVARVGLEVRGTIVTDAGSVGSDGGSGVPITSSFCHQYYGETIALQAGRTVTALVGLRGDPTDEVYGCEEDEIACHDNVDNDHNGLVDCNDPRCVAVCRDAAAPLDAEAPSSDADIESGAPDAGSD